MRYEAVIEDNVYHFDRHYFEADNDKEAIEIAKKKGFGESGSYDALWRVDGEYADHNNFTKEEQEKMAKNYTYILVK